MLKHKIEKEKFNDQSKQKKTLKGLDKKERKNYHNL